MRSGRVGHGIGPSSPRPARALSSGRAITGSGSASSARGAAGAPILPHPLRLDLRGVDCATELRESRIADPGSVRHGCGTTADLVGGAVQAALQRLAERSRWPCPRPHRPRADDGRQPLHVEGDDPLHGRGRAREPRPERDGGAGDGTFGERRCPVRDTVAGQWDCAGRNRSEINGPEDGWCPWPGSNQHSLRNSILSRARLPIPPQGRRGPEPGTVAARYNAASPPVNPRGAASSAPHPIRLSNRPLPSSPPASASTAFSGWGIMPSTLRRSDRMPAMWLREPLGLVPWAGSPSGPQ